MSATLAHTRITVTVEEDAQQRFWRRAINESHIELWNIVGNVAVTDDVTDTIINHDNPDIVTVGAAILHQYPHTDDTFTDPTLIRRADTVARRWARQATTYTYNLLRWPLADASVLNLLRHGDAHLTAGWLSGRYPNNRPTAAMYTQLVGEPGHANIVTSRTRGGEAGQPIPFDGRLLGQVRGAHPEGDYDPDILAPMNYTLCEAPTGVIRAATGVLAGKLTEHFGDDIGAWNLAVALAGNHTGSINELVELVAAARN